MVYVMFLVAFSCIAGGMGYAGHPEHFLDLPSFFIVFLPSIALCTASHGFHNLKAVFAEFQSQVSPQRAKELDLVARSCGNHFLIFGWIGMLIGMVHIMRGWDVTRLDQLTPAVGVMLLTVVYGLCVKALIFNPLGDKYRRIALGEKND